MKKLLVVSSAPLVCIDEQLFLYSPYEKEMQLWAKYANEIIFCCPVWKEDKKLLIKKVSFPISFLIELNEFDILTIKNTFFAIPKILQNVRAIYNSMKKADHIHLRSPGNVALLACFVQIAFPKKQKTVKYAGNWDSKSNQPFSYRIQKWVLSNTFLTKNMQVLVYGEWPNQTKNIKSFFTATYAEKDKQEITTRSLDSVINFLFVGTLSSGKKPLYAIQLIEELYLSGYNVALEIYGEGVLRIQLENYIKEKKLQDVVHLKGNQINEKIKKAYQESHFLVLPSKSEGWPKVVAEAMFWGSVPLVTPVSCVPYMVDNGKRGVVLFENKEQDIKQIELLIQDPIRYDEMAKNAIKWSRQYTTDRFEEEIRILLG